MRPILLCVLSLSLPVHADPVTGTPAPPQAPAASPSMTDPARTAALPLRARLDKDAIRTAIAAVPEEKHSDPRRRETGTLGATSYQAFSKDFAKDFANARLPDCLHSEGLKNQPTFFLSGFIALPFIAVARLRGVCR
jgi:hypothetical protein